jgi:uncharacterized protein (TIGR02145 family)
METGEIFGKEEAILITVEAYDPDGNITEVLFYDDDQELGSASEPPFQIEWNITEEPPGSHTILAKAIDNSGGSDSDWRMITIYETLMDTENNKYYTIVIGNQVWMIENLKTTRLSDGTEIPNVTEDRLWRPGQVTTPAYSWYLNDESSYKDPYGALYNWYTVETGKLCPEGWHVPTDKDWDELVSFLGGWIVAGGKMKETGTDHWVEPNTGATNLSGFTALPGGSRRSNDGIFTLGIHGNYWSSSDTIEEVTAAFYRRLFSETDRIVRDLATKSIGLSVRCMKDPD